MQFKIPQDVQRPDKIVGPLTLRQLIIASIGAGLSYSLYLTLSKQYYIEIWLVPVLFIAALTLIFAFYRFRDIPFEKLVLIFIEYKFKPRKRTWQKMKGDVLISVLSPLKAKKNLGKAEKLKEKLDTERLKKISEITAIVDVHGKKIQPKA